MSKFDDTEITFLFKQKFCLVGSLKFFYFYFKRDGVGVKQNSQEKNKHSLGKSVAYRDLISKYKRVENNVKALGSVSNNAKGWVERKVKQIS